MHKQQLLFVQKIYKINLLFVLNKQLQKQKEQVIGRNFIESIYSFFVIFLLKHFCYNLIFSVVLAW